MLLASFPAGPWQTNCYLIAAGEGADAVVIDPGVGAFEQVAAAAESRGIGVAGVLLTHGHLDHVAGAADVAQRWGVPVWLHPAERELLTDAGPIVPAALDLARELGVRLREPADLRPVAGGEEVVVGGLEFVVRHAPGHRPGCVLYAVADPQDGPLLFSGDVLFAGSIGRVDLPGGDAQAMLATLLYVADLPGDWVVLPGHGPRTTIARERATNPYLQATFLR